MKDDVSGLTKLGEANTSYGYNNPHPDVLETFPNAYPCRDYEIGHDTEEFTSLCPKTGQPDFAHVRITYTADKLCVETKSLKLYLFAFRNEGAFMETICNRICDDLAILLLPRRLCVEMEFRPRGGIRTRVRSEYRMDV